MTIIYFIRKNVVKLVIRRYRNSFCKKTKKYERSATLDNVTHFLRHFNHCCNLLVRKPAKIYNLKADKVSLQFN